jgi:hypothetical protein
MEEIVPESAQSSTPASGVALACDPHALKLITRTRHFIWIRYQLPRLLREVTELPDGFELKFSAAELRSVVTFMDRERRCCPFLRFELALLPGEEVFRLRLTGAGGVKRFLQAELLASSAEG